MARRSFPILAWLAVFQFLLVSPVEAQSRDSQSRRAWLGAAYFSPTDTDSRDIETVNASLFFRLLRVRVIDLTVYWSVTGTFATGHIVQSEGDVADGTFREFRLENTAVGLGPGLLTDLRIVPLGPFSLRLDGSASFILYSRDFPAGGDHYNFMWRAGPAVRYTLTDGRFVGVSFQWMHVSNGQGLGSQNPSY
ncbi:MAG: hypothetical protein R3282_03260, partial [Rhodothermales bacterium]|nr:hypothetical protein [Rhodothermales bacterium]